MKRRARPKTAHSLIELASIAIMLVIVTLLGADIGILMLADSTNERACRDAARAAASANNSATALTLAQTAVVAHQLRNAFVSNPTVDPSCFVYQDFGGNPPPNTSPFVEVTTQTSVRLPAPVLFGKAEFNPGNGSMVLRKTYTFPIIKTQLYLP